MSANHLILIAGAVIVAALPFNADAQTAASVNPQAKAGSRIEVTDYLVPHTSTVPAIAGKRVELFVREKVQAGKRGKAPVVLMIAGATISAVPVMDLQFKNYGWMDQLAAAGFDVFAMDLTGYGLSPRPMMDDPCNNSVADQNSYLKPKPLAQTCSPSYPYQLTSLESDVDEIDAVVEYLRIARGADKLHLVGWSRGGTRAGRYASLHPDKVDRLFLYAPGRYFRASSTTPPGSVPAAGVPSTVLGAADFYRLTWDLNGGTNAPFTGMCDNQFDPAIRSVISASQLEFDPTGGTWGSAGVRRSPLFPSGAAAFSGWNATIVGTVSVPTLVIRGDLDTQVPLGDITDLLADLTSVPQKVFVHVACGSHYLVWENQHRALLDASVEWLVNGTYNGQFNGTFSVDASGQISQEQ